MRVGLTGVCTLSAADHRQVSRSTSDVAARHGLQNKTSHEDGESAEETEDGANFEERFKMLARCVDLSKPVL